MYSLLNRDNLTERIQILISQKQKAFLNFIFAFLKSRLNSEHFHKRDDTHGDVFPKLRTPKNLVRKLSKKSLLRGPVEGQHDEWAQTLLKYERQHLRHMYWPMWRQLSRTKSLLVVCKIWRLFVNTLTGDGKSSLVNRDNLMQQIEILISEKQDNFFLFVFFLHFRNLDWILKVFKEKITLTLDVFRKIRGPKNVVIYFSKKSLLRGPFNK